MAHEIDFQKGKAAFVSLREKPWHGLGEIVEDEMTIEQVLPLAGLDFTVHKAPNIHRMADGTEIVSDNSFFTYRDDTKYVLGDKLGSQYTVLQNIEALEILNGLIETGNVIVETAGALRDGRRVFVTCRVKEPMHVNSDEVNQYIVLVNGHDGKQAIQAYFTNIRVVCQNTLTASLRNAKQKHSIKHTINAKGYLAEAMKVMQLAMTNRQEAEAAYNEMARIKMNQQKFWNYVGNVFFSPAEIKALQSGKDKDAVISTRKQNIVNEVLEYAETGVGQAEAKAGTAWWAYNAVTGYFANAKSYKDRENRMENLMWGSASKKLDRALQLAIKPEKVQPLTTQLSNFSFNQN